MLSVLSKCGARTTAHSTIQPFTSGLWSFSKGIKPISGLRTPLHGGTSTFHLALRVACTNKILCRMVFGNESGRAIPDSGGESDTDEPDSEWEALHALRRERRAIEDEKSGIQDSLHIHMLLTCYVLYSTGRQSRHRRANPCRACSTFVGPGN